MKVNQLFFSIIIGIGQGSQPIESFNYGAGNYKRVRDAYRLASITGGIISFVSFLFLDGQMKKTGSSSLPAFLFFVIYLPR